VQVVDAGLAAEDQGAVAVCLEAWPALASGSRRSRSSGSTGAACSGTLGGFILTIGSVGISPSSSSQA
jgi:hypothetical protein